MNARPESFAARTAALFRHFWRGDRERAPLADRVLAGFFLIVVLVPAGLVLVFRFVPPPTTPLMIARQIEGDGALRSWVPLEAVSDHLRRAVIAAEDNKFCTHRGFDWDEIEDALADHGRGRRLRGASTISQQTAKNLFLLPERSWLRKGIEAYFTMLIEALWPKRRILEVYLNIAEWGTGRFGAEAAARSYFGKPASALTAYEAARLAAVLPNPRTWRAVDPGPYVAGRADSLVWRMAIVARDRLDACVRQ